MYNREWYINNKSKYKKGGIYYTYKPKINTDKIKIKKGKYIIIFD